MTSQTRQPVNRPMWLKLAAGVLIIVGIWIGLKALGIDLSQVTPDHVRGFVLSFGAWAPLAYLVAYGQPLIPLPASIMTLAGGLAFGPFWGTLAALAGATIRAGTEFGVARVLGRKTVEKLLKGKIASLNQKIGENGFSAVLFIRMVPNVPFDLQNYGLGFSKVRFGPYLLGTFLGIAPGCFAYVYLGYSLTDLRNLWKAVLAILLMVGLILLQRRFAKRRKVPA